MRVIKGKLEATISLNKSTCYFLKTGQCSLGVAADFYLSPGTRLQPSDLLYCPSLRRAMEGRVDPSWINQATGTAPAPAMSSLASAEVAKSKKAWAASERAAPSLVTKTKGRWIS